jgi:DUF438 domain-containing protein
MSGVGKARQGLAPEGHPIHTLMEEHAIILDFAAKLRMAAENLQKAWRDDTISGVRENIDHLVDHLHESENHYTREENVLFPHMEKHGIEGPPAQMWNEHNQIRDVKKRLYALADEERPKDQAKFKKEMLETAVGLAELLAMHFNKENSILFPMALQAIEAAEWDEISEGFDDIGYGVFKPVGARGPERPATKAGKRAALEVSGDRIVFETGSFTRSELEAMLDTVPFDMTFVDAGEQVRYFSNSKERIFPRTKAIIGRKVQNCHPEKSYGVVQKILDDFRSGKRDRAEFWINAADKTIHIRYFALRRDGKFLGTVEVSQDIAPLRKLKGEKRLLD